MSSRTPALAAFAEAKEAGDLFTGIIEELGEVVALSPAGAAGARLAVRGKRVSVSLSVTVTDGLRHGDSIAVNGVCLTVVDLDGDVFSADVVAETMRRTALGRLREGSGVNLERAMAADGRFGGHIVQGHVDGVGEVLSEGADLRVRLPEEISRYVVPKGSITVDGVSLTVVEAARDWFSVALIPATLELTTLGGVAPGDVVNLEVDIVAKYVERMVAR